MNYELKASKLPLFTGDSFFKLSGSQPFCSRMYQEEVQYNRRPRIPSTKLTITNYHLREIETE